MNIEQFKFRFWEPETKRFYYFGFDDCVGVERKIQILKNSIPQQYTTGKDKNGREIYDGDIVKYKDRIGAIEFFATMFICCWNDQTDDELAYMIIGDIEVIGNIFENADLIK